MLYCTGGLRARTAVAIHCAVPLPPIDPARAAGGWTVGVCTDGVRTEFHDAIVTSVRQQGFADYEVIFCTENTNFRRTGEADTRWVYCGRERPMWITRKKNLIAQAAAYDNLCLLHDYAVLEPNWYRGFLAFGSDWDVCCMPVLTPSGNRWHDWNTTAHRLLDYNDRSRMGQMYVSGTAFCVKRDFLLANPLDEHRIWNQNEDGEWSNRCRPFWNLHCNPHSVIRLLREPRT